MTITSSSYQAYLTITSNTTSDYTNASKENKKMINDAKGDAKMSTRNSNGVKSEVILHFIIFLLLHSFIHLYC